MGITNYTIVSNKLIAAKEYNGQKLSAADKIVYMSLFSRCRNKNYCFPSIETISNDSGISKRQVNRALLRLASAQLIAIEPRYWGKKQITNKYTVKNIIEHDYKSGVTKKQPNNKRKYNHRIKFYKNTSAQRNLPEIPAELKEKIEIAKPIAIEKGCDKNLLTTFERYISIIEHSKNNKIFYIDNKIIHGSKINLNELTYKNIANICVRASRYSKYKAIKHHYAYFIKAIFNEINSVNTTKNYETRLDSPKKPNNHTEINSRNYDFIQLEKFLLSSAI